MGQKISNLFMINFESAWPNFILSNIMWFFYIALLMDWALTYCDLGYIPLGHFHLNLAH